MKKIKVACLVVGTLLAITVITAVANDWRSGIPWPKPAIVTPGANPSDAPSDAIVLFDGKDLSEWNGKWGVKDGIITVDAEGDIWTKKEFGSVQLHIEFATPDKVTGSSQGRGNSGIFFLGKYEVQILDSYDNDTYYDGQCGSIYKQRPPLVNACKKPGEWQTYDIVFNRPDLKIENGKLVEVVRPGYITVFHNGVLIQNHFELEGSTFWHLPPHYETHKDTGAIRLQNHGNPMRFRNIWVREIPDTNLKPEREREPYYVN